MSFYIKNKKGEFVPVQIEQVLSKEWMGKLVTVRVGTDEHPATEEELVELNDNLDTATVIDSLPDTSFLITSYAIQFEVLANLEEIRNQNVAVKVTGEDDLSKLGGLQKDAREKLKNKVKKVVILPTPLTVDEYYEILKVKERCDLRRSRRGR